MSFYDNLNKFNKRVAVISDNGTSYSYEDIYNFGKRLVESIGKRTLVFLVCENCFESIAAYIGFLHAKIVPLMLNPKIDVTMYKKLLENYKPGYVFCKKDWHAEGRELTVIGNFHLLGINEQYEHKINPNLALLLTTSGSTGSLKFVMQSYKNIDSNTAQIAEYLEISKDDRAITTMPMSYTYGLSIIQSHLYKGACIIATEKTLMDKKFWELIKKAEATNFGGVPYIYEILKKLCFENMNLPSLKYITQAGGKLSKELSLYFAELCGKKNIKFIVMYGQTEATARMSYLPWEYAVSKAGSMGIPVPGGQFFIIDENNKEINEPDVSGELIYKGDNVTLGYANNFNDLINEDKNNGVLHTGDMAKKDRDGFYYIVGRKKRFLKIFGNRINLDEIDELMKSQGFNCVCGGKDDLLKLYIVSADKKTIENAVDFISKKTGLNRSAFKGLSISEIPRNEAGKIIYAKLEELYG